jgi:hypothetical protein
MFLLYLREVNKVYTPEELICSYGTIYMSKTYWRLCHTLRTQPYEG